MGVQPSTTFPSDLPIAYLSDFPSASPSTVLSGLSSVQPSTPPIVARTEAPTDAPMDAPTDSFTLSPIASSTSSVVTGIAAPRSPERRLLQDILTVVEFERTLKEETDIILGVSSGDSNCVVETSAIQYDASDSVCTEFFTAAQLVGVLFCYSFQITISAPTSGGGCEVNAGAQLVTETLEENGFANAIGPVEDTEIAQLAMTNAPTTGPTTGLI